MNIKYVTFTGADDNVDPKEMLALSKEFPLVEWAILFHPKKQGVPRYPSKEWIRKLEEFSFKLNISAHMCSTYADDAIDGKFNYDLCYFAQRVQFNMNGERLKKALLSQDFAEVVDSLSIEEDTEVIIGGDYSIELPCYLPFRYKPLFDCSGGRGIEAETWPTAWPSRLNGYAGGLNPKNLQSNLDKISQAIEGDPEETPIWIDFESGIRTDDKLDLNKCVEILEVVYKWKFDTWKQSRKQ